MKKVLLVIIAICSIIAAYSATSLVFKSIKLLKGEEKLNPIIRLVHNGRTFCSGTVVDSHTIITAAHCVIVETPFGPALNPDPITIRANNNIELNVVASPVYASPQMDNAVLKGDFQLFEPRKFISNPKDLSKVPLNHTNFISCGYPLGGDLFCTPMKYEGPFAFAWAMRGVLLPGMSGGPTMLPNGTVVAINIAVTENVSLVTPIYNMNMEFNK